MGGQSKEEGLLREFSLNTEKYKSLMDSLYKLSWYRVVYLFCQTGRWNLQVLKPQSDKLRKLKLNIMQIADRSCENSRSEGREQY